MSAHRLLKGFEVELFTGRASGENVGVARNLMNRFFNLTYSLITHNFDY